MTVLTSGHKELPPYSFCAITAEANPDEPWSEYDWTPAFKAQEARPTFSSGASQTRELLPNGKREEPMYKRAMTNKQVRDFEEVIVRELVERRDSSVVPEPMKDYLGNMRRGIPRAPHSAKNPRRSEMALDKAAKQLGIKMQPLPVSTLSNLMTSLVGCVEDYDRIIRVVQNELIHAVTGIVKSHPGFTRVEALEQETQDNLTAVDTAQKMTVECLTRLKIKVNNEFMLALGANVDLTEKLVQSNPFDNVLVRETDVDRKDEMKALRKHVGTGIFQQVSKRAATKPNAAPKKATKGDKFSKKQAERTTDAPRPPPAPKDTAGKRPKGAGRGARGGGRGGAGRGRGAKAQHADGAQRQVTLAHDGDADEASE